MMIQIARIAFTLLAVLVLLAVPGNGPAQTKPLGPYTLILDFVPTGEYVPHYTALEKGWYGDEGLDVKIGRGQGWAETVKGVAAGQGEVGISDVSALIAAPANTDVKVKAIALWYRRAPHGIFVRADSPIKTPKELEGKKLAISPGNSHQILWPVFERLSGLKPNSVTWVTMDAASMPPSLIRGATDAVPFFVVHEARIRKIARQQNADIRVLTAWADLGLDLSSTSLVAREETIAKNPDGLRAFLRATLKGADYAFRPKHSAAGSAPALTRADVLVEGDRIAAVGAGVGAPAEARVLDASGRIVLPGLGNAHTHAASHLARGRAGNWTLEDLLTNAPANYGFRTPEDDYLSAAIGAIEMLKTGCTSAYDLYMAVPAITDEAFEATVRAYTDVGVRVVLAPAVADVVFFQTVPGLLDLLPADLRTIVGGMQAAPTKGLL